jgi:hypothetical protein
MGLSKQKEKFKGHTIPIQQPHNFFQALLCTMEKSVRSSNKAQLQSFRSRKEKQDCP